jgi:predicted dehydrogenase
VEILIRFAVVGTGWRSEFYARVAKALPEQFLMVAWLCRNEDKRKALQQKYGFYTTTSEDDVVSLKPDFIVSAVDKASMSDVVRYWAKKGFPVLSETPAALDLDTLRAMKKEIQAGLKIQVAEQYFLDPMLKAAINEIEAGLIGEPVSVTLSSMHDYHAASIIRRTLKTGLGDVKITGKSFVTRVTNTKTRYETLTDGKVVEKEDKHLIMEYDGGKVAFYDFMSEQYRSTIRHKYMNIRGTRGEIINDTVYFLDGNNVGSVKTLEPDNPFADAGLAGDEASIARLMLGMKNYIENGKEVYPMDEALYDAYIATLMDEAGKAEFETVEGSFADIDL